LFATSSGELKIFIINPLTPDAVQLYTMTQKRVKFVR